MKYIKYLVILLIAALMTVLALPAFAGGWAVVTLDELPGQVVAGQPTAVGFMVRQHGVSPLPGLSSASIFMQREGSGDEQWVDVVEAGEPGHYEATFTIPAEGTWNWSINTGFYPETQPMPALSVVNATAAAQTAALPAPVGSTSPLPYVLGSVGVLGLAVSLAVLARTRAPWAAATGLAAVLVAGFGFALAVPQTAASAPRAVAVADMSVEQGQRLFVAKGCVVCHIHDAVSDVKQAINFDYGAAPDLTKFNADANYLARWLDDPAAVKPGTDMPDLNLSDAEVGALVAFINAP